MKRRKFLKNSAVASASMMLPNFIQAFNSSHGTEYNGKRLVVIQLSGGNDGLNTIIPYRNDIYYRSRPTLGIKRRDAIRVTDELGFNPVLSGLKNLFDDGLLSIINNVGYPNPNRSHFRSMEIWQTASRSNEYLSSGWLGRYLDHNCMDANAHHALEIDDALSLSMKGQEKLGFAIQNPSQLKKATSNPFLKKVAQNHHHDDHDHENIAYLYKTLRDTQSSADYLYDQSKVFESKIDYPKNSFAKRLKLIAELMTADTETQVFYVSLGGFDTHAKQQSTQERLLEKYSDAVAAFVKDLKSNRLLDETLIMTFSEFGRRVKQNGSDGTDHGTANNVFLMGGKLKQNGFYNNAPDLLNLDNGDLKYEIDFRQIYATILKNWLEVNPQTVLNEKFGLLNLV